MEQRVSTQGEGLRLALSQGLLLWLLLGMGGVWASRGPLRPLCRPVNATLAAEKEACPVCITVTTSICAGYCPSMVSRQGRTQRRVVRGLAVSGGMWAGRDKGGPWDRSDEAQPQVDTCSSPSALPGSWPAGAGAACCLAARPSACVHLP